MAPRPFLVLLGDRDSRFLYANPACLEAGGCEWEELKGTVSGKLAHPDTHHRVRLKNIIPLYGANTRRGRRAVTGRI